MKLIDILARELKEWPCKLLDFAQQDYDKEIRFHSFDEHSDYSHDFYVEDRAEDGCDEVTCGGGGVKVTCSQWQAAVDALKADEYHEPDNGVEAWLHGVERDYGNDAAQKCRAIIKEAQQKLERSKACDAIYGVLTGPTVERKGNTSDMAEALYDAGYRKQVTP